MMNFNPLDPHFQANPYLYYGMLRENMPRFYWSEWGMWFFTNYEDCVAVLKDPRFGHEVDWTPAERARFPQPPAHQKALWDMESKWMLLKDAPDHTRLRGLVHKAFTPRMVDRMRDQIVTITKELLDEVQGAGQMDIVEHLAFPLPIRVISDLLGFPSADRELLRTWSRDLAFTLELVVESAPYDRAAVTVVAFADYIRALADDRRKTPREDLLTALVQAEDQGDRLTEDEMIATVMLLLIAGHETTVNLISSAVLALLRHPDQLVRLKAESGLMRGAVEEALRYDSPVQLTSRVAREDVQFGDLMIPRGSNVTVLLGAANRDPKIWTNPDVFDITRVDADRHIGFGSGIHYCLGSPLARMEADIALTMLLQRMPGLTLADENPPYRGTLVLRGLESLQVRF